MHTLMLLDQILAMEPTLQLLDQPSDLRIQLFINLVVSVLSLWMFNSLSSVISSEGPNFFATKVMSMQIVSSWIGYQVFFLKNKIRCEQFTLTSHQYFSS